MPSALFATARAKINLALHVLGRRRDGYHELDSIVVFAEFGDIVSVEACDNLSVEISGPAARGVPRDDENIAFKAARILCGSLGARITIEKWIPSASGLGGGSADAAAALLLLSELWGLSIGPFSNFVRAGADIPVCIAGGPSRLRGVGESVELLGSGLAGIAFGPGWHRRNDLHLQGFRACKPFRRRIGWRNSQGLHYCGIIGVVGSAAQRFGSARIVGCTRYRRSTETIVGMSRLPAGQNVGLRRNLLRDFRSC